jgi:DNA-binding transcriptional regulator GbsR (MarR family)
MAYKLQEAKQEFISNWGAFASHWGINKTMAQVHALLLVTTEPITSDDIMDKLRISRGNVNMNVRELINWGLVDRVTIPGERKEFFTAEKEMWRVIKLIVKERKKRELEPMLTLMQNLQDIQGEKTSADYKTYKRTIDGIVKYGEQADKTLERLIKAEENWFWGSFLKMLK